MGAEAEDGITCQRSYKAYFLHSCNCVASEKPDWPQAGSFLFLDLLKVISVGLTSFLTRSGNANIHSASARRFSQHKHTLCYESFYTMSLLD